jgi:hypothetical protein
MGKGNAAEGKLGARITAKHRAKLLSLWASTPHSLIGKHVEK